MPGLEELDMICRWHIIREGLTERHLDVPSPSWRAIQQNRIWWIWPSWLRRQIVALKIVGSSPIIHPIFTKRFRCSLQKVASKAFSAYLHVTLRKQVEQDTARIWTAPILFHYEIYREYLICVEFSQNTICESAGIFDFLLRSLKISTKNRKMEVTEYIEKMVYAPTGKFGWGICKNYFVGS